MSGSKNRLDDWAPCQSGELRQVVRQKRSQKRNRTFAVASGVTVSLLVLLAAGIIAYQQFPGLSDFEYGGISCSETQTNMPQYLDGKLDADMSQRIELHLAQCRFCESLHQEMREERIGQTALQHSRSSPITFASVDLPAGELVLRDP